MKFTKMHGIGNDYVYVNCFEETVSNPEKVSIAVSDRRFGIGSDGLILICPSETADFKMRMFNADGSEGKMCGNGSRCVGKYVYDHGLTSETQITLETLSGIKLLKLFPDSHNKIQNVEVDMGKAVLTPEDIPVITSKSVFKAQKVNVNGTEYVMTAVSMGNPHAVIFRQQNPFMPEIDSLPLEKDGPFFENLSLFPDKVNTEFADILSPTSIKMRVWERGSGETLACGTGACATAVSAVLNGFCEYDTPITISLKGGNLTITCKSDGSVIMAGPATEVLSGEIDI